MWAVTLSLLAACVALYLCYTAWKPSYWELRGVPTNSGILSLLSEMYQSLIRKVKHWHRIDWVYKTNLHKKVYGFYQFGTPTLMLLDREVIQHVFIKDFDHFADRRNLIIRDDGDNLMSEMLGLKKGDEWKALRSVMTPIFSSGKMKNMFPLVKEKAECLVECLQREALKGTAIDGKEITKKYSLDVIGSCMFGIQLNSLSGEENEFTGMSQSPFDFKGMILFKTILIMIMPKLTSLLGVTNTAPEFAFYRRVVEETMRQRETGEKRGDFVDLMMQAVNQPEHGGGGKNTKISQKTAIAQLTGFLIAGFDTISNTAAFVLYLLAKHAEEQRRLRQELQEIVEQDGDLTYESLMKAKYLDGFILETLRLYIPVVLLDRTCTKEYRIPGTSLTIPPDMLVSIPCWSIHHDPTYWPDPTAFRPERFMPENKHKITSCTYFPFGEGPRNCMGSRFALMAMKLAVAKIVLNFEVAHFPGCEELKFENTNFFSVIKPAVGGVMIAVSPLT